MPSGKVHVYCHMSRHGLGACGGGGWSLVMKTDGNKVSRDSHLSLCKNMILRVLKGVANVSFVSSRVVRYSWIFSVTFFSIQSPEIFFVKILGKF